jgi:hypothetical protein
MQEKFSSWNYFFFETFHVTDVVGISAKKGCYVALWLIFAVAPPSNCDSPIPFDLH